MSNPRRTRNEYIGMFLAPGLFCLVGAVTLGFLPRRLPGEIALGVFAALALPLLLAGAFSVSHYQAQVKRSDRLRSGADVVGRWTVSEACWSEFLIQQVKLKAATGAGNPVAEDCKQPPGPVEVLFGKADLLVGGDYHALDQAGGLEGAAWLEGVIVCLVFQFAYQDEGGSTSWELRVPVPPHAEATARTVLAHFNTPQPAA